MVFSETLHAAHVSTVQDEDRLSEFDQPVHHIEKVNISKTFGIKVKDESESEPRTVLVTDSPIESVSSSLEREEMISPVPDELSVDKMKISLGHSPSDFIFECDEAEGQTLEKVKKDFFTQESKDSLFDEEKGDENKIGQLRQFERIISTESKHEHKKSVTSTSTEQKTIFREEVEGEEPKIVMEEKVFSTEDTENYSKTSESKSELALTTTEIIKEEAQDDSAVVKKEVKELVATIDENSQNKVDETTSKCLKKSEETKETVFPFIKDVDGEVKEQLVDTLTAKEDILETTLHVHTDSDKRKMDETRLTTERLLESYGDGDGKVIEGSEQHTEEHRQAVVDREKDKVTAVETIKRNEDVSETLFEVTHEEGKNIDVEPIQERHEHKTEELIQSKVFESDLTTEENIAFTVDKSKESKDGVSIKKTDLGNRSQRDSGLFEETFSDSSDSDEHERSQQLETMAFDNMAFSDEDVVRPKEVSKQVTFKQDRDQGRERDISPEDLKEGLTKFDFAEDLKVEMQQKKVTAEKDGRLISDSDFDTQQDQSINTPQEDEFPADESEKVETSGTVSTPSLEPSELQGAVGPPVPFDTQLPHDTQDDNSETSSSSEEGQVFDKITGKFVHWEIQHQYSRQFSDSYSDQDHKELAKSDSAKSLDMGEFYRRGEPGATHEGTTEEPTDFDATDKKSIETGTAAKKKVQRVRFSLSEDHTDYYERDIEEPVHSYDIRMCEEWEKVGGSEDTAESLQPLEPHDKITEAYQQAVIASIIETRMQHDQERQNFLKELESIEKESDSTRYSPSSISSTEIEFQDVEVDDEYEEDDDDVNVEITTVSQAVQTQDDPQPILVVSRESRLAHEELLKESFDEKDRSISPSIDSEELSTTYENQTELQEELDVSSLSRKYPVTVQLQGKPLSETTENERNDVNEEERLSPIDENACDDNCGSEIKADKKVTFQADTHHLCSVSSEDLVKTSTSSSEIEPTLLAASYDLESGRVSHVVTSYDLSPDTVEKQFLPVIQPPKTILSSPEDDVFEADLTLGDNNDTVIEQTPTDADIELLPKDYTEDNGCQKTFETASAGTSSLPSPPVPSPFENSQMEDHTASDLQDAVMKMKELRYQDSTEKSDVESQLESITEIAEDKPYFPEFEGSESPFEIMSPGDLEGYEDFIEQQREFEEKMFQSMTSQASASSYEEIGTEAMEKVKDIGPALLSPDKSANESSFEHSSLISSETSEKSAGSSFDIPQVESLCSSLHQEMMEATDMKHDLVEDEKLPNGPTEVDFNPFIDIDSHEQNVPGSESPLLEPVLVEASPSVGQASQVVSSQGSCQTSSRGVLNSSAFSAQPTGVTESIIEELPAQSGQDMLVVSDQTLYGLEMPSDEAASMTTSHVECESLNVSIHTSTSVQDDTSGQIDSRDVFSQAIGIDRTDEDVSERPSESIQDLPTSPITEQSHDTFDVETLLEEEGISTVPGARLDKKQEKRENEQSVEIRDEMVLETKHREEGAVIPEDTHVPATLKGYEVSVQEIEDVDLERRTPETFLDDELDEELMKLKETPDNDIETRLDDDIEREAEESAEDRARFELKADSCDLDRPLTPTPVDKRQGFFEETFTPDEARKLDEAVAISKDKREKELEAKDELLEKTACVFVENVLEEVKVKVRFKTVLDVDDDVALVQSPLSENGGDMTDFADDLPFDEVGNSEEIHFDETGIQEKYKIEEKTDILPDEHETEWSEQLEEKQMSVEPEMTQPEQLADVDSEKFSQDQKLYTMSDEPGGVNNTVSQEILHAVSSSSLEGAVQKSKDEVDSDILCRPEENDIEVEVEINKSETDGLGLPIEHHEHVVDVQSTNTALETCSEKSIETGIPVEASTGHSTTESDRFLGKSSDSSSYSVSLDTVTKTSIETSSGRVSEQEMKSERSVCTYSVKTELSQDLDTHTEFKYATKADKKPIPIRKSFSGGSADSLDDDRSAEAVRSSENEDPGDSSSVDSFTTVVAAEEEEREDEDRMADFASLTSSIHSDVQGGGLADDIDDDRPEEKDPLEELMAWAQDKKVKESFQIKQDIDEEEEITSEKDKDEEMFPWNKDGANVIGIMPHPWRKDEEDNDSIGGSDRYDYIDRQALSVITELSDEDRFEIINKEEIESESTGSGTGTGSDSRHYSSPDFPPPSPMSSLKFFNKSAERDDISVSSSLLEFERLENEINQSRSSGSIENGSKDSFGGSLDESKFLSKSLEKDDVSISSSLADFERLEREVAQGSSDSSIEKIFSPAVVSPPETGKSSEKSSVSGSMTSLTEFERLEKEILNDDTRRSMGSVESSVSHVSLTSITSSQASLNEFERLEQEFNIAEELEREAQKIVSILESGSLLPNQYSSEPELSHSESLVTTMEIKVAKPSSKDDDIDRDSVEGKDDIEDDSLSENKKKVRSEGIDDTDSLDGDRSEMTSSITSAILKSESATKIGTEYDMDSLHDSTHSSDGAMKISSDSLGEKLGVSKPEKEKFDTDSLSDQEGVIEKATEAKQDAMQKSSDSLELKESVMEKSTDSLEGSDKEQEKVESDSLHGADDVMQASVDSLESYQIVAKHNVMEVSMESAGTGWSSASSMFSRSSIDTMKSADKEEQVETSQGQMHDVMQASIESWEEYEGEEETDNFYIISKYQSSLREAAELSKSSKTERSEYTHPYYDFESNVAADNIQYMMTGPDWDTNYRKGDSDKSPYLAKQPYEEKKKIYTMTEWEAMKKAKKLQIEEEEREKEKAEKPASSPMDKSDMSESTSDEPSDKSSSQAEERKEEIPMELSTDSLTMMEKTLTSSQIEEETNSLESKTVSESKEHEFKSEHSKVEMRKIVNTETKVKFSSKVMKGISYVVW